jgi:hypothetical protein
LLAYNDSDIAYQEPSAAAGWLMERAGWGWSIGWVGATVSRGLKYPLPKVQQLLALWSSLPVQVVHMCVGNKQQQQRQQQQQEFDV